MQTIFFNEFLSGYVAAQVSEGLIYKSYRPSSCDRAYTDIDSPLTGNEHDYLRLSLREGRVSLAVQLGSGSPFDTSIPRPDKDRERRKGVRFDDNEWHHVRVERRSSEVSSLALRRYRISEAGLGDMGWIT